MPWDSVYSGDPLEGIHEESQQQLVLGGEVCMWGETADASDVQQTIWPRAAAAAGNRTLLIICCHYALLVMGLETQPKCFHILVYKTPLAY